VVDLQIRRLELLNAIRQSRGVVIPRNKPAVVDLLDVYVKLNRLPSASELLEILSEVSKDKDITIQQRQALELWPLSELVQRKGLIKPLGEVAIDNPNSELALDCGSWFRVRFCRNLF